MTQTRLATAILAAMLSFSGSVFAQAAAEAALSHGLSSSAGSSLGKTLGSALGNAAGQVGGKLGQQTSTTAPRPRVRASRVSAPKNPTPAAVPASVAPAPGSLVVSIQGGVEASPKDCPLVAVGSNVEPQKAEPQKDDPKAAIPTADENCRAKSAQEAESHPAVLNLPAPH